MEIGTKLYENEENFEVLQVEMALICDKNGWCMDEGYDEDGSRYLIIKPPYEPTPEEIHQKEAEDTQNNLKNRALNSMMLILNGSSDLVTLQKEYQAKLNSVTNDVALYMVDMFPAWSPNSVEYKKGERVSYNDILYQVVTAHTSQESWKPDVSPSLFVKVISSISGEIPEWQQPSPENAYKKGDKVRCEGRIYESLIDNNVWKPTEYPAGWKDITDEVEEG